jgi:hypothetical protein
MWVTSCGRLAWHSGAFAKSAAIQGSTQWVKDSICQLSHHLLLASTAPFSIPVHRERPAVATQASSPRMRKHNWVKLAPILPDGRRLPDIRAALPSSICMLSRLTNAPAEHVPLVLGLQRSTFVLCPPDHPHTTAHSMRKGAAAQTAPYPSRFRLRTRVVFPPTSPYAHSNHRLTEIVGAITNKEHRCLVPTTSTATRSMKLDFLVASPKTTTTRSRTRTGTRKLRGQTRAILATSSGRRIL